MRKTHTFKQYWAALCLVMLGVFSNISLASAQQVIVISHFQEIPGKKIQLSQILDNEVIKKLAKVKGLEWMKFFYDPASGKRGSVLLWKRQADWDAYLNSDLRKELVSKMKPFLKGTVSSTSYPVYESK